MDLQAPVLASFPSAQARQHKFHARLNDFNSMRSLPAHTTLDWQVHLRIEHEMRVEEGHFIERERKLVRRVTEGVPEEPNAFVRWFEELREHGPGQGDPLFAWLANEATLHEMRWFLRQEAAEEAGFEDLVAVTQVRFPVRPKLEMARNYWDEMGRGHERGMHGVMLAAVVNELDLKPSIEDTVWEALALSNLMAALACNRRYAYQAIGALGANEMTAPERVTQVNAGLKRLHVSAGARSYSQLHAGLEVKHSKAWNQEVIFHLIQADSRTARPIAEGALMRLTAGARCFQRYRTHLGLE